ncbi:MAG: hypothetical protein B7Z55_07465 [Planctomycetales bacterium 12-60-4]|nr:MAG: hypothetical protein B7Z55_07465 [Planctomycetales bacterium 12-60-4]
MAIVTIRVLEGLERGKTFTGLMTPVSIGREDDNDIQLNDDRVSRFHAKLQDDSGRVILTDLASTNGTRVNGHPVQMKVLQVGDLVMVGRCVLLFGDLPGWPAPASEEEDPRAGHQTAILDEDSGGMESPDVEFLNPPGQEENESLFPMGAPHPPTDLRPLHRAQVSDMLAFIHDQIGQVLAGSMEQPGSSATERDMICPKPVWQKLVSLQATMAGYLRKIADPD